VSGIINVADDWLKERRPAVIAGICLWLVALIGFLDYLTRSEVSSAIFYLAPIFIIAWYIGKAWGAVAAAASSGTWLAVHLTAGNASTNWTTPIWDATLRFGIFIIVAYLSASLASALKREATLAKTDALTGLMNRRGFDEEAGRLLELARRHGRTTTVVFIDVDDFKKVNDRFGHDLGDRLLELVAAALRRSVRNTDLVSRRSGDEFVLLLPETGYEGAQACIKPLQEQLSRIRAGDNWPVTFSIGAVTCLRAPLTVKEAVKIADELMYKAKGNGHNRIVHEIVHAADQVTLQTAGLNQSSRWRT
jgi:diguanylate cyclase (GGDEF)-like protein